MNPGSESKEPWVVGVGHGPQFQTGHSIPQVYLGIPGGGGGDEGSIRRARDEGRQCTRPEYGTFGHEQPAEEVVFPTAAFLRRIGQELSGTVTQAVQPLT